jgi:hypothetical protein
LLCKRTFVIIMTAIQGPFQNEDDYDPTTVYSLVNKKQSKIDNIPSPLQVKVLNLSGNALVSFSDIQLW